MVVSVSCVPCAIPGEYHCAGNGSWVNELLGTELPKCVPGNQGSGLDGDIATGVGEWGYLLQVAVTLLGKT